MSSELKREASSNPQSPTDDIPKINFAGGFLRLGELTDDGLKKIVNPFLKKGAAAAFVLWAVLISAVYRFAPADSYEVLEGTERNANITVLLLLLYVSLSRVMQLIIRDKSFIFVHSGVMVGSTTVQLIAVLSVSLMVFFPTPVVIDPVTGIRSHLIRWAEWASLAFLMTFLTESIDMPLQDKKTHKIAWFHCIALGLSSSTGGILAFCTTWTTWLTVFVIAWILFCSLFVRLYQRYKRIANMTPGTTVDEKEDYDRAMYSLKTITVCTVSWCGLALSWSIIALYTQYAPGDSIFSSESLVLVTENVFEIISKSWYSCLLVEVHNIVFDDASRTIRRLELLRSLVSAVWDTSSDVLIWGSFDGNRINGVVSPSFFNIDDGREHLQSDEQEIQRDVNSNTTMIIEVDLKTDSYKTFLVNLSVPITRKEAMGMINSVSEKSGRMPVNSSVREKNVRVIADLLREAYRSKTTETTVMKTLYSTAPNQELHKKRIEATMTECKKNCVATTTTLGSASLLIVLRDISDRFQKFEMEKKLIAEATARTKDAEANRFTRHEVKNGILAAIGLLESVRVPPGESSVNTGTSTCSMTGGPKENTVIFTHEDNDSLGDFSTHDDNIEELDSTLRDILDTIMEHAMSKEVVNEQYSMRKERVMVPEVLSNIRRQAKSSGSRFKFVMEPAEFPTLVMDPRLLRYIYQNALSNASRYGRTNGDIKTVICYDEQQKELWMEVINLPGSGHQELMKMDQEEVRDLVFAPGSSLHNRSTEEQELTVTNSSGDGAWIMRKCAKILKGDCDICFDADRTVFSFWCPARSYNKELESSPPIEISELPENTWGVVIDDSGIQRKLMDRFLKLAGIEKERRIIVGQNAKEIYGFVDFVLELVRSHPNDKFIVIADENLEVVEGAAYNGMVSGSLCLQKILEKLDLSGSGRVLAMVRSANDSTEDIEMYESRAHGYLLKAPIDKKGVLRTILPWWVKRFPPTRRRASLVGISRSNSCSSIVSETEGYDPFHDVNDLLDVIDALCFASGTDSLQKRWRVIQERLQALKGDLKTVISVQSDCIQPGTDLDFVIEKIENLRLGEFPMDLTEQWATLKSQINAVMDAHR